jgi:hypothetical protein
MEVPPVDGRLGSIPCLDRLSTYYLLTGDAPVTNLGLNRYA